MTTTARTTGTSDWTETVRALGAGFAARAAEHDAADRFVADNYAALKDLWLACARSAGGMP
jgi:hypothetical protein